MGFQGVLGSTPATKPILPKKDKPPKYKKTSNWDGKIIGKINGKKERRQASMLFR